MGICLLSLSLLLLPILYPASRDWPGQWLIRQQNRIEKADAIILLMGDVSDRTPRAAELWKEGRADKIVFVEAEYDHLVRSGIRTAEGEATYQYLKQLGVPESAIIFRAASKNTSTVEEARNLFATIAQELPEARHLILCTSWYHSSRAAWILDRVNDARYELHSLPSAAPLHWYAQEKTFLYVFNEYLKWFYYLLKY